MKVIWNGFPTNQVLSKPTWEGNRHFQQWLLENRPFFSASFQYDGDTLVNYSLDFYGE